MLGYRSLFTADRASLHDGEVSALGARQVRSWLRDKGLDADAVKAGSVVGVGSGAQVSPSYEDTASGSHSSRILLTEASGWMSQALVHDPRDGRHGPWVWIDITSPNDQTVTKAPRTNVRRPPCGESGAPD